jgi:hypothetical protein
VGFDEEKIRLFWLQESKKTLLGKPLPSWIFSDSRQSFREEL